MSGRFFLLLLLTPLRQEPKTSDEPVERAKRGAVILDMLKAEPIRPQLARPAPVAKAVLQIRQNQGAMRRMNLELKEVDPPKEGEEEVQAGMMGRGINLQELAVSRDNFDSWLFNDVLSLEARRDRLKGLLEQKIKEAQESRSFEADSVRKLGIAGLGDIKRFLDRTEAARAEFDTTRQDFNAGWNFLTQLEPLASAYREGPFGPNSVFAKALHKIDADRKPADPGTK
jgi:hypothetical protein